MLSAMQGNGTTRAALGGAVARTREAARCLRQRPVDDIIAALDRAVARFLGADDSLRRRAEAELPGATGFSAQMIRHGLPLLFGPLRGDSLRLLLDRELGDRHLLDEATDRWRASGPNLIVHILSGNIPALGAVPMLLSLAIKSAAVVKPAAGDPLSAQLFHAALESVDADLAACVAVVPWRGGATQIEEEAFALADLVVASGSDAAIAAIRQRVPGRFIGHGHKVSFAAIGREALSSESAARQLARALAYDVSLWDQQGCLSPQLCYVEDRGAVSAAVFAKLVAAELTAYAKELPPSSPSFEEQAAILRFRQAAEWGADRSLLTGPGNEWSMSLERGYDLAPTCLHRCLRMKVVDTIDELATFLPPHRRHLEAVGLAAGSDRQQRLARMFADSGLHRICPLGTMQLPSLTWRQGGRPRVGDWVEWVVFENAAT